MPRLGSVMCITCVAATLDTGSGLIGDADHIANERCRVLLRPPIDGTVVSSEPGKESDMIEKRQAANESGTELRMDELTSVTWGHPVGPGPGGTDGLLLYPSSFQMAGPPGGPPHI
jgi:hypothetical protein